MKTPNKEFIVWVNDGHGQYVPHEFETEEEALLFEKMTDDWYITRGFNEISGIYLRFDKSKTKTKDIPF